MPTDGLAIACTHPSRRIDVAALERLLAHVFEAEQRTPVDVTVILTDHATVLGLNRRYLEHDYHTDVLSFPLHNDEEAPVEGEVYVDLDTAAERHAEFDTTFEDEVRRYAVHGVLHLLGYDDATPASKAAMHTLEDRYLERP